MEKSRTRLARRRIGMRRPGLRHLWAAVAWLAWLAPGAARAQVEELRQTIHGMD